MDAHEHSSATATPAVQPPADGTPAAAPASAVAGEAPPSHPENTAVDIAMSVVVGGRTITTADPTPLDPSDDPAAGDETTSATAGDEAAADPVPADPSAATPSTAPQRPDRVDLARRCNVYIGGIPQIMASRAFLQSIASPHGTVVSTRILGSPHELERFGFVLMDAPSTAQRLINAVHRIAIGDPSSGGRLQARLSTKLEERVAKKLYNLWDQRGSVEPPESSLPPAHVLLPSGNQVPVMPAIPVPSPGFPAPPVFAAPPTGMPQQPAVPYVYVHQHHHLHHAPVVVPHHVHAPPVMAQPPQGVAYVATPVLPADATSTAARPSDGAAAGFGTSVPLVPPSQYSGQAPPSNPVHAVPVATPPAHQEPQASPQPPPQQQQQQP